MGHEVEFTDLAAIPLKLNGVPKAIGTPFVFLEAMYVAIADESAKVAIFIKHRGAGNLFFGKEPQSIEGIGIFVDGEHFRLHQ